MENLTEKFDLDHDYLKKTETDLLDPLEPAIETSS